MKWLKQCGDAAFVFINQAAAILIPEHDTYQEEAITL